MRNASKVVSVLAKYMARPAEAEAAEAALWEAGEETYARNFKALVIGLKKNEPEGLGNLPPKELVKSIAQDPPDKTGAHGYGSAEVAEEKEGGGNDGGNDGDGKKKNKKKKKKKPGKNLIKLRAERRSGGKSRGQGLFALDQLNPGEVHLPARL